MADLTEIDVPGIGKIRTAVSPDRLAEFGVKIGPPPEGTSLFDPAAGATANLGPKLTQEEADRLSGRGASGMVIVPGSQSVRDMKLPPLRPTGGSGIAILDAPPEGGIAFSPGLAQFAESDASVRQSERDARVAAEKAKEKPATLRGGGERKNLELGDAPFQPAGVAAPPVRYQKIKGGDVLTGYTLKKSAATDMLPEHEEQQADARINKKLALQELSDVQKDELERQRGFEERMGIRLEVQRDAREKALEKQRAMADEYARRQAVLDTEHEEIQKLKVNPNQYWDGLSTGSKILAGLSMIAGGIRAARQGGPNEAIALVRSAIRDDIAGQRERLEARRKGFDLKKTTLERKAEQLGGDIAMAEKELEANMLALFTSQARADKAVADAAKIDPALAVQFAEIDEEGNRLRLQNAAQSGVQIQEAHANVPDRVVALGLPPPVKPEVRERKVELGDGRFGYARSAAQAKEAQDKLTPGSDIIAGLQELRELRRASAEVDLTPTQMSAVKQRMRAIALGLAPRMNVQVGQGAMSEDEVKQNMQKMGDPEAVIKGEADAAIEETIRIQQRANRSIARDYLYADPDATTRLVAPDAGGDLRREQ